MTSLKLLLRSRFSTIPNPSFYENSILEQYSAKQSTLVTLRQLAVFGRQLNEDRLLKSANFVREEIPVRLAHRLTDLQNLPFIVGSNPHIESIYRMYWDAFEKFRKIPPIVNLNDNKIFCDTLRSTLRAHINVMQRLAYGMRETSRHMKQTQADRFLNEMLQSRIGRRVIGQQHLKLSDEWMGKVPYEDGKIGIIDTKLDAAACVLKCQDLAERFIQDKYELDPPKIEILGQKNINLTYIDGHLQYILYELIKNSMEYTIQKHNPNAMVNEYSNFSRQPALAEEALATAKRAHIYHSAGGSNLPAIQITIGQSETKVMFRISDQGGGIPRDLLPKVWSYWYIAERNQKNIDSTEKEDDDGGSHGMGMGLCISRAYANYWGGSISLQSMEGFGTDAYLTISTENERESMVFEKD